MGTQAIEIAADLCRRFEGLHRRGKDGLIYPYICPAGYPTIGYGTVYKPNGTVVTMQDQPISIETAEAWLMHELIHTFMAGVLRASPGLLKHPRALAAITDFAYNFGVGRYRASTLRRTINQEDWEASKRELSRWVRGDGKILPGLVLRRKAESDLL